MGGGGGLRFEGGLLFLFYFLLLGRTSLWWDNIRNGVSLDEEWRQNFRMSRTNLQKLTDELEPQLIRNDTAMRKSVDVITQV